MNGDNTVHCGRDVAFMLKKVMALHDVTCTPFGNGKSKHDALATGVCKGNRQDVSEVLLRNGYAVVLEKTLPVYTAAEGEARRTGVGLWRGRFVSPADWRKGERLEEEAARTQSPCNVTGVIDNGRRIYSVPTDRKHDSVQVDQNRGERVFLKR